MQKKTIKAILNKKLNDWISSIPKENEEVIKAIKKNVIITGGSIVSMMLKEKPKDYDVYFKTKESLKIVSEYYLNIFRENNKNSTAKLLDCSNLEAGSDGITDSDVEENRLKIFISGKGVDAEDESDILEDGPFEDVYDQIDRADSIDGDELENTGDKKQRYRPIFLSSNAITLSDKIQIVVRFYGSPEEIHGNYDFVHCTNYWTSWDDKVETNIKALESIMERRLYYIGSKYPLCSLIRMRKFIKRGWEISAGEILKIILNLQLYDLTDINILRDQLVGVDSAYFNILISALENKMKEDPEYKIENSYIVSIIEKLF